MGQSISSYLYTTSPNTEVSQPRTQELCHATIEISQPPMQEPQPQEHITQETLTQETQSLMNDIKDAIIESNDIKKAFDVLYNDLFAYCKTLPSFAKINLQSTTDCREYYVEICLRDQALSVHDDRLSVLNYVSRLITRYPDDRYTVNVSIIFLSK